MDSVRWMGTAIHARNASVGSFEHPSLESSQLLESGKLLGRVESGRTFAVALRRRSCSQARRPAAAPGRSCCRTTRNDGDSTMELLPFCGDPSTRDAPRRNGTFRHGPHSGGAGATGVRRGRRAWVCARPRAAADGRVAARGDGSRSRPAPGEESAACGWPWGIKPVVRAISIGAGGLSRSEANIRRGTADAHRKPCRHNRMS